MLHVYQSTGHINTVALYCGAALYNFVCPLSDALYVQHASCLQAQTLFSATLALQTNQNLHALHFVGWHAERSNLPLVC